MKYIFSVLFTIILIYGCSTSNWLARNSGADTDWIVFKWYGDSIDGRYFPNLSIDLPLKIDGIDKQFNAQFDLGANVSMVYGNSFAPFFQLYPELNNQVDTTKTGWINSVKYPYLRTKFSLGSYKVKNYGLVLYKNFGEVLSIEDAKKYDDISIGTIGSDIFQNKVLVIDYPHSRLKILDSLPQNIQKNVLYEDCRFDDEGKILIPISVNGKKNNLLFDTGSSMFDLVTTSEQWKMITDQEKITDSLSVIAWGKNKKLYGSAINVPIVIAGKNISGKIAYMDSDENQRIYFARNNIFGITGNSLFLQETIIIDYRDKKFGILKR